MNRAAILLAFWLLSFPGISAATTYYVSTTGNNSNTGASPTDAWATPGYGSRQLQPGDTLIILKGRYPIAVDGVDNVMPRSGTASAWITIKGEAGARPVLAGRDNIIGAVDIDGQSYIRVENLEITHDDTVGKPQLYFRNGIRIYNKLRNEQVVSTPRYVVLKNIYIHHIDEFGLKFGDIDFLQIINCRIEYTGMGGIGSEDAQAGGAKRVLVKGCRLARNGYYYRGKILTTPRWDRPDGLGLEEGPGPLEVVDTVSEHNFGDGLDSKMTGTYMHHCAVANNTCDGIKLWGDNTRVENCLIYGTGDGRDSGWSPVVISGPANSSFSLVNITVDDIPSRTGYPMIVQYDEPEVPLKLLLRNCIFAHTHGEVFIAPAVNLTAEYNNFYRPGAAEQVWANGRFYTGAQLKAGELGPGNFSREPRFVDRPAWGAKGDYHLAGGSPGIDQGAPTGAPAVDLDYRLRPLGRGFDMGAYEFPPGASVPAILEPLLLD